MTRRGRAALTRDPLGWLWRMFAGRLTLTLSACWCGDTPGEEDGTPLDPSHQCDPWGSVGA